MDDYNTFSKYSYYITAAFDLLSSYEVQVREEYSIPWPLSWIAVLMSAASILYALVRLRRMMMGGRPREPVAHNRTDVDDLSAHFLTIKKLKEGGLAGGSAPA